MSSNKLSNHNFMNSQIGRAAFAATTKRVNGHEGVESSPPVELGGKGLSEDATFQAALSLALLSTSKQQGSEEPGHKAKREDGISSPTKKTDENSKKRIHKSQDGKESRRRHKRRHKKHSRNYCGHKVHHRKGHTFSTLTEENLALFDTLNGDEPVQKKSKRLGSSNLNTPPSNDCCSAESKPRKKHKAVTSQDEEVASKITSSSLKNTQISNCKTSQKNEGIEVSVATVSNETNSQWNSNNGSKHNFPSRDQNLQFQNGRYAEFSHHIQTENVKFTSQGSSRARLEHEIIKEKSTPVEHLGPVNACKIIPAANASSNSGNSYCKRAEVFKKESVEKGIMRLKSYVDHSQERDTNPSEPLTPPNRTVGFIVKLYILLSLRTDIPHIKWMDHGRSWYLADPIEFELTVLPTYFGNSMSLTTFLRKVESHGFRRIRNAEFGGYSYYHEYFLRGLPWLCKNSFSKSKKGKSDRDKISKNDDRIATSERKCDDVVTETDLSSMSQLRPLPAEEPAYKSVLTSIDSYIRSRGPKARILTQFCCIDYNCAPSPANTMAAPLDDAMSAVFGLPLIAQAVADSLSSKTQAPNAPQKVVTQGQNSSKVATNQIASISWNSVSRPSATNGPKEEVYEQEFAFGNSNTSPNHNLKNSTSIKSDAAESPGTSQSKSEAEQQQLANSLLQILLQSQRNNDTTNNASLFLSAANGNGNQTMTPLTQTFAARESNNNGTDFNQNQPKLSSQLESIISIAQQGLTPMPQRANHISSQIEMNNTTEESQIANNVNSHLGATQVVGPNVGRLSHGAITCISMSQWLQQQHLHQQHQHQHQNRNVNSLHPNQVSSIFNTQPSRDILSFLTRNHTAFHEHSTRAVSTAINPGTSISNGDASINGNTQLTATGNDPGPNYINNAVFGILVNAARVGAAYGANNAKKDDK